MAALSFAALSHYDKPLADHKLLLVSREYYDAFVDKVMGRVLLGDSKALERRRTSPGAGQGEHKPHDLALAALFQQGITHLYGSADVPKDESKAVELLQQAAAGGHAEAQFRLGLCFRDGRGATRDEAKAAALLILNKHLQSQGVTKQQSYLTRNSKPGCLVAGLYFIN
eukprot:g29185.t1